MEKTLNNPTLESAYLLSEYVLTKTSKSLLAAQDPNSIENLEGPPESGGKIPVTIRIDVGTWSIYSSAQKLSVSYR